MMWKVEDMKTWCENVPLYSPLGKLICFIKPPLSTWQHTIGLSKMYSWTCTQLLIGAGVCTYSIWRAEILSLSNSCALLKSDSMFCVSLLWATLSSLSSLSCLFVSSCSWALRREEEKYVVTFFAGRAAAVWTMAVEFNRNNLIKDETKTQC